MDQNNNVYSTQDSTSLTLRKHMSRTFVWVFFGLLVSAAAAFITLYTPLFNIVYGFGYIFLVLAEFGCVIYLSSRIYDMSYSSATLAYFGYCFLSGMTMSSVLAVYAGSDIAILAFALASMLFLSTAVIGSRTSVNLDSFYPILFGGLIALVITSFVGLFLLHLDTLSIAICYIGIGIFMGLTAYDTQKMKKMYYYYQGDEEMLSKLSIYSALELYLDFVNIFLYIIRILGRGSRSRN